MGEAVARLTFGSESRAGERTGGAREPRTGFAPQPPLEGLSHPAWEEVGNVGPGSGAFAHCPPHALRPLLQLSPVAEGRPLLAA